MNRRILVIGSSSSGKSTFAARLASILSLKHVELDGLYWGRDWAPCDPTAFHCAVKLATASPGWVVDGDYPGVFDLVAGRASVIIWLNYSSLTVIRRFVARALRRGLRHERLWNENVESLRETLFSKQSLLRDTLEIHRRRGRELEQMRRALAFPDAEWVEFRSPNEAKVYLRMAEAMGCNSRSD